MELRELWAKTEPFQSVVTHGITVGILAQEISLKYLAPGNRVMLCRALNASEEQLTDFIGYWASLHDIGKIECAFQCKDKNMYETLKENGLLAESVYANPIRHERTSRKILEILWKTYGVDRRTRHLFAGLIGAHHQGKNGDAAGKFPEAWQRMQCEFELTMRRYFTNGVLWMPAVSTEQKGAVSALLLGILILVDWIGSGEAFQDAEELLSRTEGKEIIRKRVARFLEDNGFLPTQVSWGERFTDVWPNIPESGKRPLQETVEQFFRSTNKRIRLLLLEAPMGEGKTEAGMYAALQMQKQWKKNGFYVAMPTAATSNQMVGRMRGLLEMHNLADTVRLLHAMAWLVDEQIPEKMVQHEDEREMRSWLSPVKRGLLAPYAVGTVDQAMLAATQVKYGVLRLLGLADKVLVIDEIHSYDVYMGEIIIRLLEWCNALEIPVVMLSATLPEDKKRVMLKAYDCPLSFGGYPSITAVTEEKTSISRSVPASKRKTDIRTELRPILNTPEKIAVLALNAVQEGGCICVLMNTVDDAQRVYSAMRGRLDGTLLLFHARFPAVRRDELEKECIRLFGKDKSQRPRRAIVVATQVVEQSLDVDFDGMITAVAPIDLILQRLGRVHRHEDTPRPAAFAEARAWVLIPEHDGRFRADGCIYPECLLSRSIQLLEGKDRILLPRDIAPLVQEGYSSTNLSEKELSAWLEMMAADSISGAKSRMLLLSHPDKAFSPVEDDPVFGDDGENDYLSIKTRLGEASVRVALAEPELYQRLRASAVFQNGKLCASVTCRSLAREIMENSVSIPAKKIKGKMSALLDIYGDKLIAGLEILPGKSGVYQDPGGLKITFDSELGVMIQEEDGE